MFDSLFVALLGIVLLTVMLFVVEERLYKEREMNKKLLCDHTGIKKKLEICYEHNKILEQSMERIRITTDNTKKYNALIDELNSREGQLNEATKDIKEFMACDNCPMLDGCNGNVDKCENNWRVRWVRGY